MNLQTLPSRFALAAVFGAFALAVAGAPPAFSSDPITYQVTMNTSSLTTNPSYTGPFALDFQFIDGDGLVGSPNVNNTVTVTGFTGGTDFAQSNVVLNDGDPSAAPPTGQALVGFTPGATLSFLTTITTNEDNIFPDGFSVGILQNFGTASAADIPTQDAAGNSGFGAFFLISESSESSDPSALLVETYDTANNEFTPTYSVVPAPEPSGPVALAVGLAVFGAAFARRRFRRARAAIPAAEYA